MLILCRVAQQGLKAGAYHSSEALAARAGQVSTLASPAGGHQPQGRKGGARLRPISNLRRDKSGRLGDQVLKEFNIFFPLRGVGSTVACESALRSAGTLLSRARAPLPAPWPDGGPESLRSPCCGLAIYKKTQLISFH
ncbi:hypothetical protein PoB_006235800 [Plakobranchus ocellatus]|uniref:Uncharacterized protein n=1 Tax=Plakobranchus ocellatus TaxID=259542 RepID=A0AAV4CVD4_9GAST|nr:hypothetical protein PoB_006235800 [Plakobranchus ocellatus]